MLVPSDIELRPEAPDDYPAVRALLVDAFDGEDEALLVEALRQDRAYVPSLALVAVERSRIVGFAMMTEATVPSCDGDCTVLALAPVAVSPPWQDCGIGTSLTETLHEEAKRLGYEASIVLGHAEYYPRFGYVPASRFGIASPFDVPDEVFMALELAPGGLAGVDGVLRYATPFDALPA